MVATITSTCRSQNNQIIEDRKKRDQTVFRFRVLTGHSVQTALLKLHNFFQIKNNSGLNIIINNYSFYTMHVSLSTNIDSVNLSVTT